MQYYPKRIILAGLSRRQRLLLIGGLLFALSLITKAGRGQDSTGSMQYFFTAADFRQKFYDALVRWTINRNLAASLDQANGQYDFQSAFWPMELIGYRSSFARERLAYAFTQLNRCSPAFQRGLLEVVYALWPDSFRTQVTSLLHQTTEPKIFAMCAEYLWQGGQHGHEKAAIVATLQQRFPHHGQDPILRMLGERLKGTPTATPPLSALLSPRFAPGLTVIYSFQRPDRRYPGRVIVRKPDGSFVMDSSGRLFSVPQLALSVSNLPFYLTNGNTPQGVYRMSGFAVSSSRFIGPTENIQLSLPFEIPLDSFIVSPPPGMDTSWTLEKYKLLLPEPWRNYGPLLHAFYAGQAGRTAIIAHGTTIDPAYYSGSPFYPQTPSLGCLCAFESWSEAGVRQRSDQQVLINAVKQAGNGTGYAVVLNLADKKAPVSAEELARLLQGNPPTEGATFPVPAQ